MNKVFTEEPVSVYHDQEKYFNNIFKEYRNRMFCYFVKVTKSEELSEEMTMDLFLNIWKKKESLADIKNIESYLLKSARNKAIDFIRKIKTSKELREKLWDISSLETNNYNPDSKIICENLQKAIYDAVQKLSPQRKKIFTMFYYEDVKIEKLNKIFNLSDSTIRNHIASSREIIKEQLCKNDAFTISLAALLFLNN